MEAGGYTGQAPTRPTAPAPADPHAHVPYTPAVADGPRAVVLAAGQGTRMRSRLPKMLHPLAGRPLVLHALDTAAQVTGGRPLVVVSPDQPEVKQLLEPRADVVEQPSPRGTGDALRSIPPRLRADPTLLVLSGDVPLLRATTLTSLLARHQTTNAACTLLTVNAPNPKGLGRILRDPRTGRIQAILEERDLPPDQPATTPAECNAGVYAFRAADLWPALDRLQPDNAQGEYYLTDVVALLDGPIESVEAADPIEAMGVNDRVQLAEAAAEIRRRTLESLMLDGVTVEDPATTYVEPQVRIGRDTTLRPMTVVSGATVLGEECVVGPMASLRDVTAGDRVSIGPSMLEECELADDVRVGAYVRVRPGTRLERGAYLGTHAEVKNSRIGAGSRVSHFAAVLDSDVGRNVNIGAGTVTCNYDGTDKHATVIGDGVFVGTDSILVAPLRIGEGAYVAAGSVITRDVPAGALAVERSEQRNVEGWSERRRRRAAKPAGEFSNVGETST
jgi:bifunctional UDP-N-acetylglucosamine pyrophosphorylase / glucosamine-1-phosphate N-acetyltransferase